MYTTRISDKKEDLLSKKGTVKCAVLVGYETYKNLVAMFFYDSKPVYFISNSCKNVQWVRKTRKV